MNRPSQRRHPAKHRARSPAGAKTTLSWLAIAMLTLGSVGDLGATPATAVLGLASVVIYAVPAIVFLLPAALVSAELASGWAGGVYNKLRRPDWKAAA